MGGENVAAVEVEGYLATHPAVNIAQVVGIPDEKYEEVPVAFVELRPGMACTERELIDFCRGEIARFKVPRHVRILDMWPMGATKILKYKEFSKTLAAEGWIGMTWPTEFGGGGRPGIERIIMVEEMIGAGAPIAASWVADRQMGPSICRFGTPDQRAEFLPTILSGEATWCIGMSEPDAGSDLASLKTSAIRDGDHLVVNGQKTWTSVAVPAENLIGVEGEAFKQTMAQLEHERGGFDRLASNRPLYEAALAVADTSNPLVRQQIAKIETTYLLGRLIVYQGALGQAMPGFSAATKAYCTEHEQRVAQFASEMLGPAAVVGTEFPNAIAYAPAYTIQGGTSDVMRNILGERVLGLPREPKPSR